MHSSLTVRRKRENTHKRDANKAQSLEGYLLAITAFQPGKMQIRCLTDTHIIDIKPPLLYMWEMVVRHTATIFSYQLNQN